MAHRKDITEKYKGKWYNFPTVRAGRDMSAVEAMDYAIRNDALGRPYDTRQEAERAARAHSRSTPPHGPQHDEEKQEKRLFKEAGYTHRSRRVYKKALRDSQKLQSK